MKQETPSLSLPDNTASAPVAKRSYQLRRSRIAWLLVAPALLLLAAVAGWPLFRTLFYSFTDAMLDAPDDYHFVGFSNYFDVAAGGHHYGVLADPLWWMAVGNTLRFSMMSVSLEPGLSGMLLALLMNEKFRGQGLVRTAILVPWAIPTIVSARMWSWMFHDQYGVVNDLLLKMGVINTPLAWVADPVLSMWAVVIVDVWKTTPFMALMLLAALQLIPRELVRSGTDSWCNAWQRFRRITLPLIMPAMNRGADFRVMDALRVFDLIYILTSTVRRRCRCQVTHANQLVSYQEMGSGSACVRYWVFMMVAGIAACFVNAGPPQQWRGKS
uniref:Putative palatinose permease n=1 Tax=Erwinia rhapontici TaxID=55212 RepID=Q9AI67_ERWRD|nr:putative palatinose permease [Erwinia rhapontici]